MRLRSPIPKSEQIPTHFFMCSSTLFDQLCCCHYYDYRRQFFFVILAVPSLSVVRDFLSLLQPTRVPNFWIHARKEIFFHLFLAFCSSIFCHFSFILHFANLFPLSVEPSSLSSSLPITQPTTPIHKIQIRWMIKIMSSHRKAKKKTVTEWWNDNEENTRLESRVKKLFRRVNRDVLEASIGSPINSVTRNSHSRALCLCVSSFKKAVRSNSLENVLQSSAHPLDLWMKMGENRWECSVVLRLSLCSSTSSQYTLHNNSGRSTCIRG